MHENGHGFLDIKYCSFLQEPERMEGDSDREEDILHTWLGELDTLKRVSTWFSSYFYLSLSFPFLFFRFSISFSFFLFLSHNL